MNDETKLQQILEGLLLAAGKPLTVDQLAAVFSEEERPENKLLVKVLDVITASCDGKGYELKKVASGYRFQVRQEVSEWVGKLWEERPQRYSRALLETIAIIAYRQPLTRGDIEKIRGVAVSTAIIRTLLDREWVRVVGHRDVPGRPAMYASTRQFLDYFNLESLNQLPALAEIRDIEEVDKDVNKELTLEEVVAGRVIDLPQGEDLDEEFKVLDEADEAVVAWATQPISAILGEADSDDADEGEDDIEEQVEETEKSASEDVEPEVVEQDVADDSDELSRNTD